MWPFARPCVETLHLPQAGMETSSDVVAAGKRDEEVGLKINETNGDGATTMEPAKVADGD